jgi:hypothetical protein
MACERVHDVARAELWLRTADDLLKREDLIAIGGPPAELIWWDTGPEPM